MRSSRLRLRYALRNREGNGVGRTAGIALIVDRADFVVVRRTGLDGGVGDGGGVEVSQIDSAAAFRGFISRRDLYD